MPTNLVKKKGTFIDNIFQLKKNKDTFSEAWHNKDYSIEISHLFRFLNALTSYAVLLSIAEASAPGRTWCCLPSWARASCTRQAVSNPAPRTMAPSSTGGPTCRCRLPRFWGLCARVAAGSWRTPQKVALPGSAPQAQAWKHGRGPFLPDLQCSCLAIFNLIFEKHVKPQMDWPFC